MNYTTEDYKVPASYSRFFSRSVIQNPLHVFADTTVSPKNLSAMLIQNNLKNIIMQLVDNILVRIQDRNKLMNEHYRNKTVILSKGARNLFY